MTIILAVSKDNETVMASDTRITYGSEIIPGDNLAVDKIIKIGGSYIGSSGWGVYDNILADYLHDKNAVQLDGAQSIFLFFMDLWRDLHKRYSFVNDQSGGKDSPFGDLDAKFLIANSSGIFLVSSNMSVRKFNKYYAIGSGSSYSLGAMNVLYDGDHDAMSIARRAVEAAITFDNACGGEIDIKKV
jgi:ATP-dependent protease HslVU (ClpYQ) peptidase subunit